MTNHIVLTTIFLGTLMFSAKCSTAGAVIEESLFKQVGVTGMAAGTSNYTAATAKTTLECAHNCVALSTCVSFNVIKQKPYTGEDLNCRLMSITFTEGQLNPIPDTAYFLEVTTAPPPVPVPVPAYAPVGCYSWPLNSSPAPKPLTSYLGDFPGLYNPSDTTPVVEECAKLASQAGHYYFAVQDEYVCRAGPQTDPYSMYTTSVLGCRGATVGDNENEAMTYYLI